LVYWQFLSYWTLQQLLSPYGSWLNDWYIESSLWCFWQLADLILVLSGLIWSYRSGIAAGNLGGETLCLHEGIILRSLFFSLFFNNKSDGFLNLKCHAVECQVYHSIPVTKTEPGLQELNRNLFVLNNWSRLNSPRLNTAKTQVLVCGKEFSYGQFSDPFYTYCSTYITKR
jgi:hypothetical protein